jgi:hypothetical protein
VCSFLSFGKSQNEREREREREREKCEKEREREFVLGVCGSEKNGGMMLASDYERHSCFIGHTAVKMKRRVGVV